MLNPFKPEYCWRPQQFFRRMSFERTSAIISLPLPWGCTINACPAEAIGGSIAAQGVYDLPITEALMRLTDPGDIAIDVGANIGYMTLVLAIATGVRGRVFSFEPFPPLLPILKANIDGWGSLGIAPIEVISLALSDHQGEGLLGRSSEDAANWGLASLEIQEQSIPIRLTTLDMFRFGGVGVMKIDVEGHEAGVLRGARGLLSKKLIRDIIFEEHKPYPTNAHAVLLEYGYHIFKISRSFWGPLLLPPDAPSRQSYLPPNFLATTDAHRAKSIFTKRGWQSLMAFS